MATITTEDPMVLLGEIADALRSGTIVPYLGPGISALSDPVVPMSPEALADFFGSKTTLPARAKGNAWAAAQYIESHRFRETVTTWMNDAFADPVEPTAFHRWLADLDLPLFVDTWYAGEMRRALGRRMDWAELQGITRAAIGENFWYRAYDADGTQISVEEAKNAVTLLYTPHGSVSPRGNYLISDADYVEVLTEIDIQTPIPDEVRRRRSGQRFLFLGCHFHDQLLRNYARQIMKRSSDRHYAIVEIDNLTRNEWRFLEDQGIVPVDLPLDKALANLIT